MSINLGKAGILLIVWALFIGLVGLSSIVPTGLLIIGTILYLIAA